MDIFGINFGFLLWQTLNCLIPIIWLGLSITALLMLKNRSLGETATVLWAILICILPILGAVAFWIVSPKGHAQDAVG
ncbi:MAG: hypothetical protein R6W69_16105 [Anaerolineales bacterium]|jgi:hypothetical protein